TAQLPRIYAEGDLDFAGTCVGIVERDRLIDGSRVEEGDVVVGFPSAGLHANGFTLARRVLEDEDYDAPDLLAPTRLYLDEVRALREPRALGHGPGGGGEGRGRARPLRPDPAVRGRVWGPPRAARARARHRWGDRGEPVA